MVIETKMVQDKITKGAVRFAEVNDKGEIVKGDDSTITQLYVRSVALEGKHPRAAKVTVEFID
jgi:hypothetical protein